MRRIGALAIVLAVCAPLSACGSSSSQPPFARSPKAALASIVAAALAQKSVHWTDHLVLRGRPDIVWTGDAAADSGRARVTLPSGSGRAQLLLVDDYVYARGDPAGLRYELNLTKAQAKTYAGRWISFPKSDSLYTEIDTGLTLASIVHDVTFAQITGNPLPVAWRTGAGSEFESGSFSKWNEPVNVHAPASSTPIETVRRG